MASFPAAVVCAQNVPTSLDPTAIPTTVCSANTGSTGIRINLTCTPGHTCDEKSSIQFGKGSAIDMQTVTNAGYKFTGPTTTTGPATLTNNSTMTCDTACKIPSATWQASWSTVPAS
jgi:hypothetical protein